MPITVSFKVSGGTNFSLDLELSSTIEQVKNLAKDKCDFTPDAMKIIFKGHILKNDQDTLESLKVESGNTMHLVKSAAANIAGNAPAANAVNVPAATPTPEASSTSAAGIPQNDPAMVQLIMAMMAVSAQATPIQRLQLQQQAAQAAQYGRAQLQQSVANFQRDQQQHQELLATRDAAPPSERATAQMNLIMQNPLIQSMPEAQREAFVRRMCTKCGATPAKLDHAMARMFPGGAAGGALGPLPGAPNATPAAGAAPAPGAAPYTAPGTMDPMQAFGDRLAAALAPGTATGDRMAANLAELTALMRQDDEASGNSLSAGLGAPPVVAPDTRPAEERLASQLSQLANMGFADRPSNIQALERANGDITQAMNAIAATPIAATPVSAPDSRPAEERFTSQLTQLADMGFPDHPSNIQALEMANGDITQAMNFLLDQ